jgi:hypothetical protein
MAWHVLPDLFVSTFKHTLKSKCQLQAQNKASKPTKQMGDQTG